MVRQRDRQAAGRGHRAEVVLARARTRAAWSSRPAPPHRGSGRWWGARSCGVARPPRAARARRDACRYLRSRPWHVALDEARAAAARGEVPVGAVVTDARGGVLARAGNEVEARRDPSAHAEMLALRAAAGRSGRQAAGRLHALVTLEPCPMCAQAASFFRVRRVVLRRLRPQGRRRGAWRAHLRGPLLPPRAGGGRRRAGNRGGGAAARPSSPRGGNGRHRVGELCPPASQDVRPAGPRNGR